MALPTGFNPFEHLQDTFRRAHNIRVREFFSDLGDETWDPDITTPRGSLRVAATIVDSDNSGMMDMRLWLFYVLIQGGQSLWPPLYTFPADLYQQSMRFLPQITLVFSEDLDEVETGYSPLTAELSCRLVNETAETLTEANLRTLARTINTEFGAGGGYRWRKGRVRLYYKNQDQGVECKINAFSETEGKQVLGKLLDLQGFSPVSSLISFSTPDVAPPTIPEKKLIIGKQRRMPRRLPIGNVRFRYAELHIWGVPQAITLVDLTGRRDDYRD